MQLPLDMAKIHAVRVERRDDGEVELTLEHSAGDRRSVTHEALLRQLRVRADAVVHRFDEHARVGIRAARCEIFLEAETGPPLPLATLALEGAVTVREDASRYLLSPFELRYAADTGALHLVPLRARAPSRWRPVTDLHTHFAGCVRGKDLVSLAEAHDVVYPRGLLEEAKIRAATARLAELGPTVRDRLAARLEVPLDRRVTFLEMERIYRLRSPITKSPAMLVPLCRRIAADYQAMGVTYAELSLGSIVDCEVLRAIHREVPRIEEESGVTLRFLAAISRHDDPEWDLDLVERIKTLAGSVYLAGIDIMGHETNSTHVVAPVLSAIAQWADQARPGFVVRVHAGESPAHPENVRVALELVRGHDVELRIGHGLFGVDDATLEAIVRSGAIVEFNLDSNVALNHLQSARAVPIRRYVEAGARVVLGSDGYGIYQTSPAAAAQAALIAGLDAAHLEGSLAVTEQTWIARSRERDAERLRAASSFVVPDNLEPVHFTPAVMERRRAALVARDALLDARLGALGKPVVTTDGIAAMMAEGRSEEREPLLLSIAGAWTTSWEAMTDAERTRVTVEMTALVEGLEPGEAILLTGGTRFGVEGIVGRAAMRRGLVVIAALVRETPPSAIEADAMSHACFVGETLYDKAAGLYELLSRYGGACLFVGGGQIVSDEIQTAQNLRLRFLLMAGAGGASARHAIEQPARAFERASEALHALRAWRALSVEHVPHWYEGPNPTVDVVVVRTVAGVPEVLLVLRDRDAPTEAGKWALPGGFVASASPRGGRWSPAESDAAACVREVGEETGLVIDEASLVRLGVFEGHGRDPRDTARSWSRSTAFLLEIDPAQARAGIAGGDDAADARWFALSELGALAFDHARIIDVALARLRSR